MMVKISYKEMWTRIFVYTAMIFFLWLPSIAKSLVTLLPWLQTFTTNNRFNSDLGTLVAFQYYSINCSCYLR